MDLLNLFYQQADAAQKKVIDDLFKRVVFHDFTIQNAKSVQLANGEYETTIQPQYIQIDPRRLRIDRTPGDNLFKIEK